MAGKNSSSQSSGGKAEATPLTNRDKCFISFCNELCAYMDEHLFLSAYAIESHNQIHKKEDQ